jgi:tetratricopeptide (TPR) repeat protein
MSTEVSRRAARLVALVCVGMTAALAPCWAMSLRDEALQRGLAHYEGARMAEALMAFEEAAEADPESAMARFGAGIVCAALGWLDRGERELGASLAMQPDFPEAHDELGDIMLRRRMFDEAERHYTLAVLQRPGFAEALLGLGHTYATQRRFPEARAAYDRAVALDPGAGSAHRSLGEAHAWEGALDAAIVSYQAAVAADPSDVAAHHGIGIARLRQQRYEDAVAALQRVVALDPRHKSGWNSLARAHSASGQTALAEKAMTEFAVLHAVDEKLKPYLRALEADAADVSARYSLMKELLRADRTDEALRECDRLLAFDATFVPALDARVRIHLSREEWQPGYVWAGHLTRARPDDAMAFLYLGMAAGVVGEVDDAITAYRRAVEIDPDAPAGYNNLAWILYRNGRSLDEAAEAATRAVGLEPKPAYLDTLSRIHEARGEYSKALAAVARAVAAEPDNPNYIARRDALRAAIDEDSR